MSKEAVLTHLAPAPVGAYSQAVKAGGFMYISGQIAINPETGAFELSDIETESRRVLDNVKGIVESVGATMDDIVKVSVFLTDMHQFGVFNSIYETYFQPPYPARALVEVSKLPKEVHVEVEAIVKLP